MKIDPITLRYLLESMEEGVREMFVVLRDQPSHESIQVLARVAHKLKGESTVVGLDDLSRLICRLEDSIESFQGLKSIGKAHYHALAVQLKHIVSCCEQIQRRVLSEKSLAKPPAGDLEDRLTLALKVLAEKVADGCGKKVCLDITEFRAAHIPVNLRNKTKDIVVQLVRNAIAHGIELPATRRFEGKDPIGLVTLTTQMGSDSLIVTVRDNGQGVNLENIRTRLIFKYKCAVKDVAAMSDGDLLKSLFLPGFSTLTQQQEHAGRGVGLDLVRDYINAEGGNVGITFKDKQYTQFMITFPLNNTKNTRQIDIPLLVDSVNTDMIPILKNKVRGVKVD